MWKFEVILLAWTVIVWWIQSCSKETKAEKDKIVWKVDKVLIDKEWKNHISYKTAQDQKNDTIIVIDWVRYQIAEKIWNKNNYPISKVIKGKWLKQINQDKLTIWDYQYNCIGSTPDVAIIDELKNILNDEFNDFPELKWIMLKHVFNNIDYYEETLNWSLPLWFNLEDFEVWKELKEIYKEIQKMDNKKIAKSSIFNRIVNRNDINIIENISIWDLPIKELLNELKNIQNELKEFNKLNDEIQKIYTIKHARIELSDLKIYQEIQKILEEKPELKTTFFGKYKVKIPENIKSDITQNINEIKEDYSEDVIREDMNDEFWWIITNIDYKFKLDYKISDYYVIPSFQECFEKWFIWDFLIYDEVKLLSMMKEFSKS